MLQKLDMCILWIWIWGHSPSSRCNDAVKVADITTNKEEATLARSSHALDLAGYCVWSWALLLVPAAGPSMGDWLPSLATPIPVLLRNLLENSTGSRSLEWRKLPSFLLFSLLCSSLRLLLHTQTKSRKTLYIRMPSDRWFRSDSAQTWRRQPCFWGAGGFPNHLGAAVLETESTGCWIHNCRPKHAFYNDTCHCITSQDAFHVLCLCHLGWSLCCS